jgi:uncharacterized protein (TIGR02444 family)
MADTLWNFAAASFKRADIAEGCLQLQDEAGADVNMLLTAAWLAAQDRGWRRDQIEELIAMCTSWRAHCVLPLRAVRRYLKGQIEIGALHTHAKALELEAEKLQLDHIQSALRLIDSEGSDVPMATLLAANLQAYLECIAISNDQLAKIECTALVEALLRK